MNYHFNIGDRVVYIDDSPVAHPNIFIGYNGTVCSVEGCRIGVRWDDQIQFGHSCDGACEKGFGWYVFESQLRRDEDENVEIDEDNFIGIIGGTL